MKINEAVNGGNRIFKKTILTGVLILLMLVPGRFVAELVAERQSRQTEVVNEVCGKWAGGQTVNGPVLMVPYLEQQQQKDGKVITVQGMAYILPEELKIKGAVSPREKKRGLYSVSLYTAKLNLAGNFGKVPLKALGIAPENILWREARLVINISDMHGIDDTVGLQWNTEQLPMEAGVPDNSLFKEGLSVPVALDAEGQYSFSFSLSMKGSQHLFFTPLGKTTTTDIAATWKDPSFDGMYLPQTTEVSGNNVRAQWKILPLARNYPQCWKDSEQDLSKGAYGVKLIQAVDGYSQTSRSVKYALLFISLTFTFFLFLEILQKRRIHPVQYLLVGLALTIFYTLLLSISEYTGFNIAYVIAALATMSLIAVYVHSIFKSSKTVAWFTAVLVSLYTYIFVIIQSEDYALLFGSIGLFIIMAVIMHFSRKVEWYDTPDPLSASGAGQGLSQGY